MRLRAETYRPLPARRGWVLLDDAVRTVSDLTLLIRAQFSILDNIQLELLDFPLLSQSPLAGLVTPEDVIQVKVSQPSPPALPPTLVPSNQGRPSRTSIATSMTTSLSEGSLPPARQATATHQHDGLAPPFKGSIATRSRNARKRKKRSAERDNLRRLAPNEVERNAALPSARAVPSPVAEDLAPIEARPPAETLTMFGLTNRNKRKGFKRGLPERAVEQSREAVISNLLLTAVDVTRIDWQPGRRRILDSIDTLAPLEAMPLCGSSRLPTRENALEAITSRPAVQDPSTLAIGDVIMLSVRPFVALGSDRITEDNQIIELSATTLQPGARLYTASVVGLERQAVARPQHLLATASDQSPVIEVEWTLRVRLPPQCKDGFAQDDGLPTQASTRSQARRAEYERATSPKNNGDDVRDFVWSEIGRCVKL